ncbi:MAG: hypothetical protein R3B40_12170 [Polyangiales bacterium]|nr:hypothetical protein [Myxococcales bacterium]MCB9657336.1 hypothetical protein [Sandaracinaceae bacterium]
MSPSPPHERAILVGSSALFASAVGVHTYIVLNAGETPHDAAKSLLLALLVALGSLVVALPLGALLRALPRKYGAGGRVVAWLAVGLTVALVFASEQALQSALGEDELVGFVTTKWLWEHAGWGGSVFYLLTVPIDLVLMFFVAIMRGIAAFVVPPATGLCCGASWVVVALPFLVRGARRRAPPGA